MTHTNDNQTDRADANLASDDMDTAMNEALKSFCADYFSDKFLFASASEPRQLKTVCSTFGDLSRHSDTEQADTTTKPHTNEKTNNRGNTTC